jgi:4-amino-4-deoxy-L-arabinose transferase-like glycosyltransferase
MIKAFEKYPRLSIIAAVLIMLLPNLDVLNVTIMEARNFITAREMVNDGNWLLTTFNGEPRYQKPPLPTWIAALFGYTSGFKSIFLLRLPSVLMVVLTGIITYLLSLKFLENKLHSFVNALILVTSFYVIGITIEAPWDIYNHGFMLTGIYYLIMSFNKEHNFINIILSALFIGLSLLSKGPISFYALLLPFLISYGLVYKFKTSDTLTLSLILISSIVIGGWWYLYVRVADPDSFLAIAKKETSNWSNYNIRPFYYYWSFFTQSGLWTIPAFFSLLYPYLKDKVRNLQVYQLSILWVLISVILLSLIPEKKSRYLMPVLIPLAINTGFYIDYIIREFKNSKDKFLRVPVYFNFGLIALIGIVFPLVAYYLLKDNLSGFWLNYSIASILLFLTGISIMVLLFKKEIKKVFYLSILFFGLLLVTGLPLSKALVKNENYQSLSLIRTNDENIKNYSFGYISPELIWYYGEKIKPCQKLENIDNSFGLLTEFNSKEKVIERFGDYNIQYQKTFDLNPMHGGKKNYRDRLKTDYYILIRK